jgi:uncharacterized protein (DUF1800 family)
MNRRAFLRRAVTRPEFPAPSPAPPLGTVRPAARAAGSATAPPPPYTGPWTETQAAHLIRRTQFGLSRAELVDAMVRGMAGKVDHLIATAQARPLPAAPSWSAQLNTNAGTNVDRVYELQRAWYAEMAAGGLRERMALLWHDHFATEAFVYGQAAYAHQYLSFLRTHALGSFETMVREIGKLPAMLRYLNNDQNDGGPGGTGINENYGREVLELFTMGQTDPTGAANYTQADVVDAARALSGWTLSANGLSTRFVASRFDAGTKTLFGQTGAWGYDDVFDLLFAHRAEATADFVARKLYGAFVHPVPDPEVSAQVAYVLRTSGFDIAAAVRALLTSAHFYDPTFTGSRMKAPVELGAGLFRELGWSMTDAAREHLRTTTESLGQTLLNPPNVAGWPGYDPDQYRAWVTTGTLAERRGLATSAVLGGGPFGTYDPIPLAQQIADPTSSLSLARSFAAHLLPVPLSEAQILQVEEALLDGAPRHEWVVIYVSARDAARVRLRGMIAALVDLPEYQLV